MTPTRLVSGAHRTNKWYAFDASNERLSLFSLAAIGGFGLVVVLGHSREILYYGANRLYRSFDRGDTWTAISENLTSSAEPGDDSSVVRWLRADERE